MTTTTPKRALDVAPHKGMFWAFLGYLLLVPLLISPVMVIDPFVSKGGNGETSLTFSVVCAVIGSCIVLYYHWFSIRNLHLGEQIRVDYAMRTRTIEWKNIEAVFVARKHARVKGFLVEVFELNLTGPRDSVSMAIDPLTMSAIISVAKFYAPETCKISEEILSVRVRH